MDLVDLVRTWFNSFGGWLLVFVSGTRDPLFPSLPVPDKSRNVHAGHVLTLDFPGRPSFRSHRCHALHTGFEGLGHHLHVNRARCHRRL